MNFDPSRLGSEPLFIGLGHYKRTGKDSFADFLIRALYYRRPKLKVIKKSFAWKLKQICFELYGWAGLREPEFYETLHGAELREIVLPELGKSPRQIWIDFGTDAVREHVYERTWLDYMFKAEHNADVVIVPDTRFLNEAEEMQALNATLIKVVRPDYGPGKNKPDRQLLGYKGWHNVIGDEGSMGSLQQWADRYAEWICGGAPVSRTPEEIEAALAVEQIVPWQEEEPVVSICSHQPVLFNQELADRIFGMAEEGGVDAGSEIVRDLLRQLNKAFPGLGEHREYLFKAAA
jgi:deoxynucleotide monophosphate kinase-like protein